MGPSSAARRDSIHSVKMRAEMFGFLLLDFEPRGVESGLDRPLQKERRAEGVNRPDAAAVEVVTGGGEQSRG